jgi:hypothetical protein
MPRKPVTGILQQDYRLMRSMAAGAVVRISVSGKPVIDGGLGTLTISGARGVVGVSRLLAAGWLVLDEAAGRFVMTEAGAASLAAHEAERHEGRTELQRALQTVAVRRAD